MKWIFVVLVIAFLATIVFSWGMGGFKGRDKPGIIGEVDGYDITLENFEFIVRFEIEKAVGEADGKDLDENERKRIREDAWDNEVDRILKYRDARRLGIDVTDRQIAHIVGNYPPQEIQQVETFQIDGKFDIELYRNFLRDPQAVNYLLDIERRVRDFLFEQELNFHVTQSVDVSGEEVKDEYLKMTATGRLKFIFIQKDEFDVDSAEVTEEMLRRYYKLFSGKYRKYPQCRFAYVKFKLTPSPEDTLDILQEAKDLLKEALEGADFGDLAEEYSEDKGTAQNGGDLGWFDYGSMAEPFSDAAFGAEPGEIVGPVKSMYGYHVIKIEDKRTEDGIDEVKARHILLKIKPSPDTRDQVYADAYNFAQDVIERDFSDVAAEYDYTIDTTDFFSEAGYIRKLARMRMAAEFCFNNPVGTVSGVYQIPDGYIVFQIVEATEEGIKVFEEVRVSIHKSISKILLNNKIWDRAAELIAHIETPEDLERIAEENNYKVYTTEDSLRPGGKLPEGVQSDNDFLKQAFRLEEGGISDIIQTKRGCYIAYMERKSPWIEEDYLTLRLSIYGRLFKKKEDQALRNWVREMRIAADINDYRYKYFKNF